MKKSLITLGLSATLLIGAAVSFTSCGNADGTKLITEGTLVVGMECAYAPFNWTETANNDRNVPIANVPGAYADGYDVQVAKKLAEALNLKLEVKAIDWDGLIPSLNTVNTKGIDLIIAGMSPTDERKKTIDFTDGYYRSTHVVLVSATGAYGEAKTLSDFANAKVVGQTGTLYADLVPQIVEASEGAKEQTSLATVPEIVTAILNGTSDATILEEPVAKGILAQYPGKFAYITPTGGFDVAEEDVLVSIGIRKNFSLKGDINNFLSNTLTQSVRTQLMQDAIDNAPAED